MAKTRLGPHDGGSVDEWFQEEEERKPGFIAAIDAGAVQLNLSADLKRIREAAGLTQGEVAQMAGTTQSSVARAESGNVMPSFDLVAKIASACGKAFAYSFPDRVPARPERSATKMAKRTMRKMKKPANPRGRPTNHS